MFLSHFKGGIQYLHGGVGSGFKHVEPDVYPKRLLIVQGMRYPRVFEVPCKSDSFDEGDVFILDNGMDLYFWAGTDANIHEKTKGLEMAVGIKNDDRMTKPRLFYPRDVGGEVEDQFWALVEGGKPAVIPPAKHATSGSGEAEQMDSPYLEYKFYVVCETKDFVPEEILDRPLRAEMLKPDQSFILKTMNNCYVWQGLDASIDEKRYSMNIVRNFK